MFRLTLYLCVITLVTSCGGGGGGGGSSPAKISNRAPVITDPGALSVREGVSDVVSLSGTDPDGNSLSFSIVSGDDQSLFTITSAGSLSFETAPDFEVPSDADSDNEYLVAVEVTDGTLTDRESLVVSVTDAFEGRVVDAPLSGASVFIDLNGNNQLDADEPSGTTDPNGYFQVDSFTLPTVGVAKVVSMGGTDITTGKALPDLALISDVPTDTSQPANVTPLTTVISAATTPEEKAQVLSALGISGSVEELLTSDGWAKAEAGDENAKANQRLNQQVGLLLQTATTLTDDDDDSTDVSVALAQSVAKQISAVAQSEGSVDLTASATIKAVLTDAAQEVTPSIDVAASVTEAVADAVATVNTVVADITLDPLSEMAEEIIEASQDSLQTSILDVVSGSETVDSFAEETGAAKLFENVTVAADATDSDSDGIPDRLDPDDDNDNVRDTADAFPLDSTETVDTDSDGTGNNADTDDDGDSVLDSADAYPLISLGSRSDTDGDGRPNDCDSTCQAEGMAADDDDDGDGVADDADAFPLDSTETVDTDSDGTGNNADTDDDGDGVADVRDLAPLDALLTPPTAIITADLATGNAPLRVSFSTNTSLAGNPADSSDAITEIVWDLVGGDGGSGNGPNFEHIFLSPGDYTVSAVVTNSDGYSHKSSLVISVTELDGTLTISGTINIPSNYFVDSDINDADSISTENDFCSSAQIIPRTSIVSGYANQPGAGNSGRSKDSGDIYDLYKITAYGGEVINLTSGDTTSGDLDLRLGDSTCNEIDASIGDSTLYETLTIPNAGVYYIQVEAYSGASTYLLEVGGSQTLASHGWNASAELVEEQLLVVESQRSSSSSISNARQSLGLNTASSMTVPDYKGPVLYTFNSSDSTTQTLNSSSSGSTSSAVKSVSSQVGLRPPSSSAFKKKLDTLRMAKKMRSLKQFEHVEPNFIHKAFSVPNDPLYINQKWHYEQINMPKAWDRSTGAGTVKVAVIDTGVIMNHPDLQGQLTTDGYDFISSPLNSGDGDGPDSDPSDPGDGRDNFRCPGSPSLRSSFHGTHVAGTVGATGNDSKGVTGVNWNVDIMPIRVLGCYGGESLDIIDGILYAAGLPNSRNVLPDSPADIINLSLGNSSPNIFSQLAVDQAREAGVIVIAAAGNGALEGNPINYPAAYSGVVSVGATNPDGNRADYSTYNDDVDVAAPGGFGTEANATIAGRVLSTFATINPDGSISTAYEYTSGTSMAAPHVAGVASLMKGIYPDLTPNDFDAALLVGFLTTDYGVPGKDQHFGHGLIDADKALQTAEAGTSGVVADFPPLLVLSNSTSNLGATGTQVVIQAINAGGGSLTISQVSKSADNISVLAPETDDGLGDYVITIDRTGLAEGVYQGSVEFSSDAGIRTLLIDYEELPSDASEPNAGQLYTLLYNIETEEVEKEVSSVVSSGKYTFSISDVTAGVYALITGSDIDNDLFICGPGEVCAVWPTMEDPDLLFANQTLTDLDLNARYLSQIQGEASSLGASSSSKLRKIPSNRCSNAGTKNISANLAIDPCFKRALKRNSYVQ